MARNINLIVVHCSASPDGDGLYRGPRGAVGSKAPTQVIDAWHAERGFQRTAPIAKSWNPHLQHIGYHHVISCDGSALTGRDHTEQGAHCAGYNANSIGICMTGTARFTAAQFATLAALLTQLSKQYSIPLMPPSRKGGVILGGVCGHRDLSPDKNGDGVIQSNEWLKTCPGFDVAAFLASGFRPQPQNLYTGALK